MNTYVKKCFAFALMGSILSSGIPSASAAEQDGKWMTGEYHNHVGQSSDAAVDYMTVENHLNVAFREDMDNLLQMKGARVDNINYGQAFDYLMIADHLRNSPRDPEFNEKLTARWQAIEDQQNKIKELQAQGKYKDKIIYSGFEWDMMALDHASVALIDSESNQVPIDGIHEFEWLYSYDSSDDMFTDNELEKYGARQNDKNDVNDTYAGVRWVKENYPDSFILPNHPTRHDNGDDVVDIGEVTIEHLRKMNDIAPDVVFGFEGMPGNQMSTACELREEDVRGGADEMISVTGGVWDALLSEGHRFFNFTNSDFHFKFRTDENSASGYWASEFSRNNTWVEKGDDGVYTFADVVEGMRSGNSYAVNGELISDLDFTVYNSDDNATMGEELEADKNEKVTVKIRFKIPEYNNYKTLFGTYTGLGADNTPDIDHIDLIMGHITGKVDESQYNSTDNTDAKIIKTFTKEEIDSALGSDGYYTLTYTTEADADMYFRIRGLSFADVDENGDPVTHEREVTEELPARFDYLNDYNYTHLSFYANPIWVDVEGDDWKNPFTDVTENSWFYEAVKYVNTNNIINGVNDNKFAPNETTSRAMIATILARLDGVDTSTGANWYEAGVNWAKENGISDGTNLNASVSREQLATMLYRYAGSPQVTGDLDKFTDSQNVSDWAKNALVWATQNGIITGTDNNTINPNDYASRAQVATILMRLKNI